MKVLVVGSDKHLNDQHKIHYKEFCQGVGKIGANNGFEFVVGSEADYAPDGHIVSGADSANKRTKVHVISTKSRALPFSKNNNFKNIITEFEETPEGDNWSVARVKQILNSDMVIAIGGGETTESAIYVSKLLKKPVLLAPFFEGAAKKIFDTIEKDYDKARINKESGANKFFYGEYEEGADAATIKLAKKLFQNNPYKDIEKYKPFILTSYIISLCLIWVLTFFYTIQPLMFSIFLLTGISSLLGSSLRISIKSKIIEHRSIMVGDLIYGSMIGLIISVFFSLIYLVGGITVKGDLLFLNSAEDFQRIGLTMSLLGASASFLVEKSIDKLKNTLSGFLENNGKS